jgi:hypothetical protein
MRRRLFVHVIVVAAFLSGCHRGPGERHPVSRGEMPPGMRNFDYLACDGGPHLILPGSLSKAWKGVRSMSDVIDPASDYGRACAAVKNQRMALVPVGTGQAIVLQGPPLSAWGRSPEGWVDVYYLESWKDTDLDALIGRAVAATPSAAMKGTDQTIKLEEPGLILLYAGDRPGDGAYGQHPIPIDAGSYRVIEGQYRVAQEEAVTIYRLRPSGT